MGSGSNRQCDRSNTSAFQAGTENQLSESHPKADKKGIEPSVLFTHGSLANYCRKPTSTSYPTS